MKTTRTTRLLLQHVRGTAGVSRGDRIVERVDPGLVGLVGPAVIVVVVIVIAVIVVVAVAIVMVDVVVATATATTSPHHHHHHLLLRSPQCC